MYFLLLRSSVTNFAEKIIPFVMIKKTFIGQLIKDEVRRQDLPINDFADRICCSRKNVYDIFKKSSIHLDQLARISRVLNRNFFEELARDPSLIDIDSEEAIREMENRRAVSQFMEVVPGVLQKLQKQPIITFGRPLGLDDDVDLPDFMLTECSIPIVFTAGGFISEKYKANSVFEIKAYENSEGIKIYSMINTFIGSQMIDVKLDYKTEDEWEKTLRFVFETFHL